MKQRAKRQMTDNERYWTTIDAMDGWLEGETFLAYIQNNDEPLVKRTQKVLWAARKARSWFSGDGYMRLPAMEVGFLAAAVLAAWETLRDLELHNRRQNPEWVSKASRYEPTIREASSVLYDAAFAKNANVASVWGTYGFFESIDRFGELFPGFEIPADTAWELDQIVGDDVPRRQVKVRKQQARTPISQEVRSAVWQKTDGICWYCGKPLDPFLDFHVDHVIPYSRGGSNDFENLVPACSSCNITKHAYSLETFRERSRGGEFWFELMGLEP